MWNWDANTKVIRDGQVGLHRFKGWLLLAKLISTWGHQRSQSRRIRSQTHWPISRWRWCRTCHMKIWRWYKNMKIIWRYEDDIKIWRWYEDMKMIWRWFKELKIWRSYEDGMKIWSCCTCPSSARVRTCRVQWACCSPSPSVSAV